jgi:hypothetical protein
VYIDESKTPVAGIIGLTRNTIEVFNIEGYRVANH